MTQSNFGRFQAILASVDEIDRLASSYSCCRDDNELSEQIADQVCGIAAIVKAWMIEEGASEDQLDALHL